MTSINLTYATSLQSYVGGLYRDQGLRPVQIWLGQLLRPYLRDAYSIVRHQHGLPPLTGDPANAIAIERFAHPGISISPPPSPPSHHAVVGHLGLFNQRLQQENRSVEWSFVDSIGEGTKATPVWIARAVIDGQEWGSGRGNTKKAAKNEAAKQGLKKLGVNIVRTLELRVSAVPSGY